MADDQRERDEQEGAAGHTEAGSGDGEREGVAIPDPAAAQRAAQHVADFTGRHPESVISIEHSDSGWLVGVEVVETHRIPDTTDVPAAYEVRLDGRGGLHSYRRTRRYAGGQLHKECR